MNGPSKKLLGDRRRKLLLLLLQGDLNFLAPSKALRAPIARDERSLTTTSRQLHDSGLKTWRRAWLEAKANPLDVTRVGNNGEKIGVVCMRVCMRVCMCVAVRMLGGYAVQAQRTWMGTANGECFF